MSDRSESLAEYGIHPHPAEPAALGRILIPCKVGLADPTTVMLVCHIAWLQRRLEMYRKAATMWDEDVAAELVQEADRWKGDEP